LNSAAIGMLLLMIHAVFAITLCLLPPQAP
jgi:hypothetical protein